jgi:inosose dehydratase
LSRFNRREFLGKTPGALALLAAPQILMANVSSRARRIHMGVQTNAWGVPIKPYEKLLKIAETLHKLGYEGFETSSSSLSDRFAEAAQCRKDFAARHERLSALYCSGGPQLLHKDEIPDAIESLRRMAGYIATMGGSYQTIGSAGFRRSSLTLDPDVMHMWTDALNKLGEGAKAEGIELCYHNHREEFEGDPTPMSFFLRDTDPKLVRINLDVIHCIGLVQPAEFSTQHFHRIAVYHLADVKLEDSDKIVYTKLGEGQVNLSGVFEPLLNSDWEGWLEIEDARYYPHPLPDPVASLREDRRYLKQVTEV